MKRYPTYKNSGIEWIGDIPEHWEVSKLKFHLENLNSKRIPLSSVQRGAMTEKKYDYYGASGVIDKVEEYIFDGKNILIGEDGANLLSRSKRLAFIADGKYWVNNHAHILNPRKGSIKYWAELLETIDYTPLIVGAAQPKLTQDALMNIDVIAPPEEEQTQIANFLDHQTGIIDQLIEKKKLLIEKLKEQRQAIINEAVTKGLDPSAKMKDSGIEWIGEIPEHWEVVKLKYLLINENGALKTGPFGSQLKSTELSESGEYVVYNQRNVLDNQFETFKDRVSNQKYNELLSFNVKPGDILMTTRGTIGKANIVPREAPAGLLHPCLIRIRIDEEKVDLSFVMKYFNDSGIFIENVLLESDSTTIEVIYGGTLNNIILPLPTKEEQTQIANYLDHQTGIIDQIIEKTELSIEKLEEQRRSIISEAVTGKVDVRDWEN